MALQELISKKLQLESKWANQALSQKRVTPDMKWIDIEIKSLKKRIKEQIQITDLYKNYYDILEKNVTNFFKQYFKKKSSVWIL